MTTKKRVYFHVRDYYPLGCIFPDTSINKLFCNFSRYKTDVVTLQPPAASRQARCRNPNNQETSSKQIPNSKFLTFGLWLLIIVWLLFLVIWLFCITPSVMRPGLGSYAFARRYSRNNYCSLFHLVLKCFTSQGAHLTI